MNYSGEVYNSAHLHGEQVHLVQFDFGLTRGLFFDILLLPLIKNTETRKKHQRTQEINVKINLFICEYNSNLGA